MPSPTSAARSEARRLSTLNAVEAPTDSDGNPLIPLTPQLSAALNLGSQIAEAQAKLSRQESDLRNRELALALSSAWASLQRRCVPTVIGGRDGLHPDDGLDLCFCDSDTPPSSQSFTPQYLGHRPPQIVWVPVPLYPVPLSRRVGTSTFLEVGRSTIRESRLSALFPRPQWNPHKPLGTALLLGEYSLTAFATVSINPRPFDEVSETLDRRSVKIDHEQHATTSDLDPTTDSAKGRGPLTDSDTPAFIPSNPSTHGTTR
jgi:hypothetical protein